MLTVNINDAHLEKRIAKRARSTGKSKQKIVEELLIKALPEKSGESNYATLDPKEYGYYITDIDENISENDNTELFSHVEDSEKYVENLRKNIWRKQ